MKKYIETKALTRKKLHAFKKEKILPIEWKNKELFEIEELSRDEIPVGLSMDSNEVTYIKLIQDGSKFLMDNNEYNKYVHTNVSK